jgi:hypothetical protein
LITNSLAELIDLGSNKADLSRREVFVLQEGAGIVLNSIESVKEAHVDQYISQILRSLGNTVDEALEEVSIRVKLGSI